MLPGTGFFHRPGPHRADVPDHWCLFSQAPPFQTPRPPLTGSNGGVPPHPKDFWVGGPCPVPGYPPLEPLIFPVFRRKGLGGKRSREGDPPVPTQAGTPRSKKCTTPPGGPGGSAGLGATPPYPGIRANLPPWSKKQVSDGNFRGITAISCADRGGTPLFLPGQGPPSPNF